MFIRSPCMNNENEMYGNKRGNKCVDCRVRESRSNYICAFYSESSNSKKLINIKLIQ